MKFTDDSEGITHRPDDTGSKQLPNVGKPDYTAQQPRRQPSSTRQSKNYKSGTLADYRF
jgi:hypothetical protein